MEKKRSCVWVRFSTILWGVAAVVLCAAPSGWAVTYNDGEVVDINYAIYGEPVEVGNATVNLLPGAYIDWYLTANAGSTVNIKGGQVALLVAVNLGSNVTVYGTYFEFGGTEYYPGDEVCIRYSDGPLTVVYEDGTEVDLPIDCYFEIGGDYATIKLAAPGAGGPEEIEIDIKPGSNTNAINLGSNGVIPVAILSDFEAGFDATTVDPETVFLAGSGVRVRGKGNKYLASQEDVNADGKIDLVVKVETKNLELEETAGVAILTIHETSDPNSAVLYEGSDEITIVPPA